MDKLEMIFHLSVGTLLLALVGIIGYGVAVISLAYLRILGA